MVVHFRSSCIFGSRLKRRVPFGLGLITQTSINIRVDNKEILMSVWVGGFEEQTNPRYVLQRAPKARSPNYLESFFLGIPTDNWTDKDSSVEGGGHSVEKEDLYFLQQILLESFVPSFTFYLILLFSAYVYLPFFQ